MVEHENEIGSRITELYAAKEYRPTGVAVLYNNDYKILLVKSAVVNAATPWSFPQGGIEDGETLDNSILRELEEETGIENRQDLETKATAFYEQHLDAESGRKDKRGFTKGKYYIFSLLKYNGDGKLTLKSDELSEARWVDVHEASQLLKLGREDKAIILIEALKRTVDLINPS